MNPLQERRARVTVNVSRSGADGAVRPIVYQFVDHRMSIAISQGGGQMGNARVQLYGLPLDAMNQIARIWLQTLTPVGNDTLSIDVWTGSEFSPLFRGTIMWSAVNAAQMPDVMLEIEANDAGALMIIPSSPYAQEGPIALRDVLAAILGSGGYTLHYDQSVPELLMQKVRVDGNLMDQVAQVMSHYPELAYHFNLQQMVVRPINGPVQGAAVPINKYTGMVSYPVYSTSGVTLATLFNPTIRPGAALDIETAFDFVNRTKWVAAVLQHTLQPNMPGGQWLTQIAAQSYGTKGDTDGNLA